MSAEDGGLLVSAPVARSIELSAALARSEVYIAEMAPVETSLEEYFLEVTGAQEGGGE